MLGMSKKEILRYSAMGIALGLVLWAVNGFGSGVRPSFPHAGLTITRADGTNLSFKTEVANSLAEQSYGLMFLKSLPADAGMIFPYDPPHEVAFWMKDTLIPLDMLFVRPDGTIGLIVAMAQPLDVMPISSQGDASSMAWASAAEQPPVLAHFW